MTTMIHQTIRRLVPTLSLICALFAGGTSVRAQATPETKTNLTEISDAQAALRANLLVQEQLHSALRAIEQARQDADTAARRNANFFNNRLKPIQKNLADHRGTDLESLRNSNRFILTAASILGAIGLLALLCTAYFQVRVLKRVAEVGTLIAATIPHEAPRALGEGSSTALAQLGSTEQSNARFVKCLPILQARVDLIQPLLNFRQLIRPDFLRPNQLGALRNQSAHKPVHQTARQMRNEPRA